MEYDTIYNEGDLEIGISKDRKCLLVNDIHLPLQSLKIFNNNNPDIYHQIINKDEEVINISIFHKRALLKKFVMELKEIDDDGYMEWLLKSRKEVRNNGKD